MIGFYSPAFGRRNEMKRHKSVSSVFLSASLFCLILALAPIPSPFGAEMGNNIALTCFSAFLSVAMVEGLEFRRCCREIIVDAWKRLFRLYDYAYRSNWYNPAPWFFKDEDAVSRLIEEAHPSSVCIPGIPRKTDTINEYSKLRADNDPIFSEMSKEQQLYDIRTEIECWIDMMDAPIKHYWVLHQTAREYAEFCEELNDLPRIYNCAKSLFLEVAIIADEIDASMNLNIENCCEKICDFGWGSSSLNYLGLKQCDELFGKEVECTFGGTSYYGDVFQQKLYSCIDKLFRTKLIYKPEDDEARKPWGESVVPSAERIC